MIRNGLFLIASMLCTLVATAQKSNLPVKEWNASTQLPFVLYLSGDGGFNAFSNNLCETLNKAGYSVAAVNSKSYFWSRKTPEQAAQDLAAYLEPQLNKKNPQLILIGYSFGADVLPFIVNRLPESMKKNLASVILLSPSTSTDFEIHLMDMFGKNPKRSMDVVVEINKMNVQKTATIFGSDEAGFPTNEIKTKNYANETMASGHHFEGNADKLVKTMTKYF